MNLMSLSPMQSGLLKGTLITTLVFSAGIGIDLYFLRQKHEKELDELQKVTARDCFDFAAEHYEKILRHERKGKGSGSSVSEAEETFFEESAEFQQEMDAMNNYEATVDQWDSLKEEVARLKAENERLLRDIATSCDAGKREGLNEIET